MELTTLQTINLKKINFSSFVKLNIFINMSLGIIFGIIGLLLSFFGQNVYFNIGNTEITGVVAGLINLIFFPVMFGVMGVFLAVFAYLPFKFMVRKFNVKLTGKFGSETNDKTETFQ